MITRRTTLLACALAIVFGMAWVLGAQSREVTFERLLNSEKEPGTG